MFFVIKSRYAKSYTEKNIKKENKQLIRNVFRYKPSIIAYMHKFYVSNIIIYSYNFYIQLKVVVINKFMLTGKIGIIYKYLGK